MKKTETKKVFNRFMKFYRKKHTFTQSKQPNQLSEP